MISYPRATKAEILTRVNAMNATWIGRAAAETAVAVAAGGASLSGSGTKTRSVKNGIWSEIKHVFMELQHFKCIFCERAFAKHEGAIEHDVEHYRPKGPVAEWVSPAGIPKVKHKVGPASQTGYYWLAYDLENYAAACKVCNSTKKRNYFPIVGTRGRPIQGVATLDASEQPLLLFPMVEDPRHLITFTGILAVPVHNLGIARLRAEITIAIFNLNGREELWDDRFRAIRSVYTAYDMLNNATTQVKRDDAMLTLTELTSEMSPQSACAKAYLDLLRSDHDRAWDIYQAARASIRSPR